MSSDERFPYSRRAIVGAGSIGLVAAAAPAFAQSSKRRPSEAKSRRRPPKGCKIREPSTRSRRFAGRSSPGRDLRAGWIRAGPRRDVLSRVGPARWPQGSGDRRRFLAWAAPPRSLRARGRGRRDQSSAGRGGGRARGHRRFMKAEGRTALSIPGDIRDEAFCKRLVAEAVRRSRRPRYPCQQRGTATDPRLDPRYFDRGF